MKYLNVVAVLILLFVVARFAADDDFASALKQHQSASMPKGKAISDIQQRENSSASISTLDLDDDRESETSVASDLASGASAPSSIATQSDPKSSAQKIHQERLQFESIDNLAEQADQAISIGYISQSEREDFIRQRRNVYQAEIDIQNEQLFEVFE